MKPSITILTGAGISAESGLRTFRDADGLWEGHRVEDVATPVAFGRNPSLVLDFYNQRRAQLPTVEPNAAHMALAELEQQYDGQVTLITQNVDDLHERGGSENILHIHGELLRKKCTWCHAKSDCLGDIQIDDVCQSCSRSGGMRPDIVWFGEMPYYLDEIERILSSTGTFISIGTSGHVYPAAGFSDVARRSGAHTIELNREETTVTNRFHEHRVGPASETVPALVAELLA